MSRVAVPREARDFLDDLDLADPEPAAPRYASAVDGNEPMTLESALAAGWSIIPCGRDKKPTLLSWKPFQRRRPTEEEFSDWQKENPATWTMITGAISGRIALDFDGERGRQTLLKRGLEGIRPYRSTPSGGLHIDFVDPGWPVHTIQ